MNYATPHFLDKKNFLHWRFKLSGMLHCVDGKSSKRFKRS